MVAVLAEWVSLVVPDLGVVDEAAGDRVDVAVGGLDDRGVHGAIVVVLRGQGIAFGGARAVEPVVPGACVQDAHPRTAQLVGDLGGLLCQGAVVAREPGDVIELAGTRGGEQGGRRLGVLGELGDGRRLGDGQLVPGRGGPWCTWRSARR